MYTKFNKQDVFNDVINEKIEDLIQICNKERMPIFISVCTKNNDKETHYENEMFSSASNNIILKDDRFPEYVNVLNGFRTIPPADEIEIDFD